MKYTWAVATDTGRVRRVNQDSVSPSTSGSGPGPAVVLVADGMGGHVAGDRASRIATKRAVGSKGSLKQRVEAANLAIFDDVAENPEFAGMGTTMTMFELGEDDIMRFAHVGDSRAYLLRDGELRQLTNDHTVVAEYVRQGSVTPEEAVKHPQRNLITRALGLQVDVEVDTGQEPLASGDRLLLCSDGVNGMIDDQQIQSSLELPSAEEAAWDLIEKANRAGGQDNITALVVAVD